MQVDVVIVGGGVAGLWTLDELRRQGHDAILVEKSALGDGQTIWSQGIIHGGLKYSLKGLVGAAASSIRELPDLWRRCLAGDAEPDLSGVRRRSDHCWVWQTRSIGSRLGMLGARAGLRVAPEVVEPGERPAALRECPGVVARVGEQVIDPASLLDALASRHPGRVALADIGPTLERTPEGVRFVLDDGTSVEASTLVLCAGNGNAALRERLALDPGAQQVRPLRMVLARARVDALPELQGHCVDRAHTRVTITTDRDEAGRRVWQIGGEVAEHGAALDEDATIRLAQGELADVLPGLDLSHVEWATYLAPRAEGRTAGGKRPDDATIVRDGPIITAWPTKLVLAPILAQRIAAMISPHADSGRERLGAAPAFDLPRVATPPWSRPDTRWVGASHP